VQNAEGVNQFMAENYSASVISDWLVSHVGNRSVADWLPLQLLYLSQAIYDILSC